MAWYFKQNFKQEYALYVYKHVGIVLIYMIRERLEFLIWSCMIFCTEKVGHVVYTFEQRIFFTNLKINMKMELPLCCA